MFQNHTWQTGFTSWSYLVVTIGHKLVSPTKDFGLQSAGIAFYLVVVWTTLKLKEFVSTIPKYG